MFGVIQVVIYPEFVTYLKCLNTFKVYMFIIVVFLRNGLNGRLCMLRFLCEAAQLVIPTDTLFQKLLKLIFT